jgi:hypothetical protein
LGVWELAFVAFRGLFFWVLNPLYFGGPLFSQFYFVFDNFNVLDVLIEGVQVLFRR